MLGKLQFWVSFPTPSQQLGRCPHPEMCRWEMGMFLSQLLDLCACQSHLAACTQKHIQEGKAGLGSCSLPSVCLPESTNTGGKTWHRFGIPVLALGFLGIGKSNKEPLGAGGFFFSMRKIFLNFMGGGLGAADVTF